MNKYLVKIEDSVLPDSYTFDELIANGLLDERDEKIQVKDIEETDWVIARDYPFTNTEVSDKNNVVYENSNLANMSENYTLNEDGTINRPGNFNRQRKPDSNLFWAIICISVCLPFGILALMESVKVDSLFTEGDYDGALKASEKSKKWSMWCLWAWLIILAIIIIASIAAK